MRSIIKTSLGAGVLALSLWANPSYGQDHALYCRGGPSGLDFQVQRGASPARPTDKNYVRVSLRYRVSNNSKAEYFELSRMEPGSCGWGARKDGIVPPGEVLFDTYASAQGIQARHGTRDTTVRAAEAYPDTASIRRYLSVPNQYWVFYIVRGEKFSFSHGYRAVSVADQAVGPLQKAGTTLMRPAPKPDGTSTIGEARQRQGSNASKAVATLKLVEIHRVLDRFDIKFTARPHATPTVLYSSTEKPVREPSTGRWFFPGGVLQGSGAVEGGFRAEVREAPTTGIAATYTASSRLKPERGKLYHYIITIPKGIDAQEEQITGQFTAMRQDVRIVFNNIDVLYTRHEAIRFALMAEHAGDLSLGESPWEKGSYTLDRQVLTFENAPDRLRVLAWGYDRACIGCNELPPDYEWNLIPGRSDKGDWNVAKREFNIGLAGSDLPLPPSMGPAPTSLRLPFKLRSVDGYHLMFEVHGYIEVTRK